MCWYTGINNWPCINVSFTSQKTDTETTMCHWSRGYDIALSDFLELQKGWFVCCECDRGIDAWMRTLCFGTLYGIWESYRYASMYRDAGQWRYCFNLLKGFWNFSLAHHTLCCHLGGHVQSSKTPLYVHLGQLKITKTI